jgi:hypothetical protein
MGDGLMVILEIFKEDTCSRTKGTIFWNVTPCIPVYVHRCSETSVEFCRGAQHYVLQDSTLRSHHCENLKSG